MTSTKKKVYEFVIKNLRFPPLEILLIQKKKKKKEKKFYVTVELYKIIIYIRKRL